ncbi:hypothetical protein J0H58_36460 [bacterium]|nr:hypothetical protein [bacterium]
MSDEPAAAGSFWSSIRWPPDEFALALGVMVTIGVVLTVFRPDPFFDPAIYQYVTLLTFAAITTLLWAAHRVLVAWIWWPSRYRVVRWLKAAAKVVLTDPANRH